MTQRPIPPPKKANPISMRLLVLCFVLCMVLIASAIVNANTSNACNQARADLTVYQNEIEDLNQQIIAQNETTNAILEVFSTMNMTDQNATVIPNDYTLDQTIPLIPNLVEKQIYVNGTDTLLIYNFPTLPHKTPQNVTTTEEP